MFADAFTGEYSAPAKKDAPDSRHYKLALLPRTALRAPSLHLFAPVGVYSRVSCALGRSGHRRRVRCGRHGCVAMSRARGTRGRRCRLDVIWHVYTEEVPVKGAVGSRMYKCSRRGPPREPLRPRILVRNGCGSAGGGGVSVQCGVLLCGVDAGCTGEKTARRERETGKVAGGQKCERRTRHMVAKAHATRRVGQSPRPAQYIPLPPAPTTRCLCQATSTYYCYIQLHTTPAADSQSRSVSRRTDRTGCKL